MHWSIVLVRCLPIPSVVCLSSPMRKVENDSIKRSFLKVGREPSRVNPKANLMTRKRRDFIGVLL